jgi:hypothetical protein
MKRILLMLMLMGCASKPPVVPVATKAESAPVSVMMISKKGGVPAAPARKLTSVTGFTLINAVTEADIMKLVNGAASAPSSSATTTAPTSRRRTSDSRVSSVGVEYAREGEVSL